MFPMELDHQILSSLPLPTDHGTRRVIEILKTMVVQRVNPYFRNKRGADLMQLARVKQSLSVRRLEDDNSQVRAISLMIAGSEGWDLMVHERIFDYLSFVIPLKPEYSLGDHSKEERQMLALVELMLRHEIEHLVFPRRKENEVIKSDVAFAMDWWRDDPTSYRMLRGALGDEMNGVQGEAYLELFDYAEEGKPYDCVINRIIKQYAVTLADLPIELLSGVFPPLEEGVKTWVLGECHRQSRSTSYSLVRRASSFDKILRLFSLIIGANGEEAIEVFNAFRDRWGVAGLFHELDIPEESLAEKEVRELFELFAADVTMTGEIDTQGRITGIGGLALKLETAYAAGSKTMIIPKENLHGTDGIARLPDALKQELQILTYSEWKGPHEPFDYTKHVFQVVAVDHILQAMDVAFIDGEKLAALHESAADHGRMVSRALAARETATEQARHIRVSLVSDPGESGEALPFISELCGSDDECVILANPRIRDKVGDRLSESEIFAELLDFDPERETLSDKLREIGKMASTDQSAPFSLSLSAPLDLLKRDGIQEDSFPPSGSFEGLKLFAGCRTLESVRIRECGQILNRVLGYLVHLDSSLLNECPFLVKNHGIHMVSLAFIPERYRLDVQRAEELLHGSLRSWLQDVEAHYHTPGFINRKD